MIGTLGPEAKVSWQEQISNWFMPTIVGGQVLQALVLTS